MYFLYSLLLTFGLLVASPLLVFDAIRKRKYITGLAQRLGAIPTINTDKRPVIWLHCVSVGEATAAQTVVKALVETFPGYRLVISTTTITGQAVARRLFADQAAAIFYFPIDWAWTVRRVLRAIRPSALLIMETELWPRLFRECHARKIPVFLLNGRISNRSFRRYQIARGLFRRVLNDLSAAFMQSRQDAERVRELGMDETRIRIVGNLKFDTAETRVDISLTDLLRQRFGFDGSQPLIVAASTHEPEERAVIEAFKLVRGSLNARLMIAPRHPERFARVASQLEQVPFSWVRRSNPASPSDSAADIILLDSVGELSAAYPFADIAFVGGSIAPHGGHNVLEPAALGICVVTGPHMSNFSAIIEALLDESAMIQIPEVPDSETATFLGSVFIDLLTNETSRQEIGKRAQAVCRSNTGATKRIIDAIAPVLNQSSTPSQVSVRSVPASAFK